MLSGEMGHQNQVIVYIHLSSAYFPYGGHGAWKEEKVKIFTRVTQSSFSGEYYGPAFLFYPNGVTCAVRFEFPLQSS